MSLTSELRLTKATRAIDGTELSLEVEIPPELIDPAWLPKLHQALAARRGHEIDRLPVVRSGGRPPISRMVRELVYRRDGDRCLRCSNYKWARSENRRADFLNLDHIVPWSAGGIDKSTNLQTLCDTCNSERSNYSDIRYVPAIGIVRICTWCLCENAPERPAGAFDVYCAAHRHYCWAIPGWQVI